MKNTIRCCISCILPCGSLDVIRIVHANGRVEELSGTIKASDIMKAYPKHVLKKPSTYCSFEEDQGICPKIVVLPPDAQLQRGKIYFLMPEKAARAKSTSRKKNKEAEKNNNNNNGKATSNIKVDVSSDKYLSDILSETPSTHQRDRRGRSAVWRPHLDSISETPIEAAL